MRQRKLTQPNSDQADMSVGSKLCTQCGLCCTGALHNHASLESDELGFAESLGLEVMPGEKPRFALPCPRLTGTLCSIYQSRPQVCSRYKCQLLQDVESGKTGFGTAVETIQHAKTLINDIERQLPAGTKLPEARIRYLTEKGQSEAGPDYMPLRLALTVLCLYIDRHFKGDRETNFMAVEPMRSNENILEMQ